MAKVRVKICGVRRAQDALAAADAGADAVGFVFAPQSARFLPPKEAGEIIALLPPFVDAVGVFVDPDRLWVEQAVATSRVNVLQFHGAETDAFCRSFGLPHVKCAGIETAEDVSRLASLHPSARAWLLDSSSEGRGGGSGLSFDWSVVGEELRGRLGRKWILAGGLNPRNVRQAIETTHAPCVDVSSGVESAPGVKDCRKIRQFVEEARSAEGP